MLTRAFLADAYRHMEWADATVWAAVPGGGEPDPRLRQLLVHIHTVQRAFLAVWTGRSVADGLRMPETFATLEEVRAWAEPVYAAASAFVATVDEMRLAAPLEMPWAGQVEEKLGRPPGISTLADTCFQVVNHSTYHRGQVNARLRELGVEPPLVDYIAWIWFGRPDAAWPAMTSR
jgi:uncharacterized damage-inducible protein DinB